MNVRTLDLFRYRLPLVRPLPLKDVTLRHREGLLLRLRDEAGHEGWGEAAPLPGFSPETLPACVRRLQERRAALEGLPLDEQSLAPGGALEATLEEQAWPASVRFGVELAAWNARAQARGLTLPEALADAPRPIVSLNGLLLGTTSDVRARAEALQQAGYRALKLKVGRLPVEDDAQRVRNLSDRLADGVELRLDANRAWSRADAMSFAQKIAGCPVAYVEEPLADPAGLPALVEQGGVPVALDESLVGLLPEELARHRYARAVVLKPTLLGGLSVARRLAHRALDLGMTPVYSAAFEAGPGLLGLIALAAGTGTRDVPAGLDTYDWLAEDVWTPRLVFRGGRIDVAEAMRTPRRMNADRLQPVP